MKLYYVIALIGIILSSNSNFAQTTVSFNYTGGVQNWVVPPCVTSISVTAAGADGGGTSGGNGAVVTGTLTVTPGQTLQITVGGSGNCPGGGYGGGGIGANASSGPDGGCGGGGATTINVSPFTMASRVLVAGGGGGMGGGTTNVAGGTGGCASGVAGNSPFGVGGGGGSQTAGGVAGAPWISSGNSGTAGSAGVGGNGGTDPCYNIAPGGGGGGGYYGGGGGGSDCWDLAPYGGGSGGGGSSLVPAGGGCNPGTNNGAGYVTITYTLAAPTAYAGPDVVRCFGAGAVTIGADPVCTVEGTPFSWSSGAGSGTIDLTGGGQNHGQASVSPAVTTTYTLTVGSAGCLSTDQVTVVVDMPPTASNPAPLSVACTSDIPAPNVAVVTTEADDITIPPTVTWISDVSNGGTCPNIVTRTYRVTDACGNFVNVTQTITAGATSTVVMPANGSSTVACPSATNTAPTPPTVMDQCGRTLAVSAPVISAIPACSGTRTYSYTYTNCLGGTYPWVYTYTVSAPTVTMPANGSSTVACPAATSTAPTVPTVLDNCGRTLTVSAPVISALPTCSGTRTYTYTFTSCSGTTYPWVYTYTVSPPTVTMPANGSSTVACPSATSTAPTAPTVLDNCGRTLTVSAPVISAIPTCSGTRTYTYTYTSCSGTAYPWVYTYTVSPPTVTMPADGGSTVACPSATSTAPTAPTVLDNCGRTLTVSAPVISALPTCSGTRTYTYTYTSCSGTTYPWVYTYTVSAPTVTMPANGSSTVTCPTAAIAPTTPTVLDNCGRTLTVSAPVISAAPTCSGTQTYTYTYTSCSGTTYPWVYTYTISAPTVTMPANGSSTVACPSAVTAPTAPTVLDNCGRTLTVSAPVISAAPTCSGTQTYTYTYTSCSGTTYPWVYTYTISAPTVTMPANGASTVTCITAMAAPTAPTVLDNCGRTLTVSAPVISPDPACGGTKTYTYTYTSCSGTTYPWIYTYTFNDNIAPTASNPAPISVAGGVAPAPDPLVVIDEADNCSTPTVVWLSDVSDNGSCPEIITRTYRVTDACGNQILVTQLITIGDAILPTASNPAPIAVDCIANVPAQNPAVVIDEADNGSTPTVTWEDDTSNGLTCPQTITRRYRVTDDCGNFIFVSQTITVDDNIAPVFTAPPANITVACIADVPAMTNLNWTDNCAGAGTVLGTDGALIGGTCGGTITRTWTYTDPCGNPATVTQTITVDDNIAPVFAAAPAAVTVACAADVPAMTNLSYTDNCDAAGSVAGTDVSNGGTCPEIITRTWTFTDACGNTSSTTQTITVHDLIAPVFAAAPAAVTVECLADVPAMINLGYTDNCDAAGTVAGTDGALVGGACGGTITRTWTIADACGNTSTATQTITVDDNTNPTASNPATTTVPGGPAPAVDPLVVIDEADNCSTPVVAFVSESNDGAACPLTITRIYSVTDACGNTINVTHTILITDPFPPTASNPAPIAVECIGDVPAADITVVTDEADNQGVPTVAFVNDVSNGMTCPEIITRTYSVTDLCGGQIFVTQTITVEDITAPVFAAAPAAVTVACAADVPAMTNLGYTDNCDPAGTVVGTDASNGGTCPEIITRTWTFTDACGNTSSTTQTITVHDLVAPVFAAAPAAVTVACAADVPAMTNLSYTDNCDAAGSVAGTDVSNGGTCPEIITRTWTFTDACGNTSSTTQTITVHDLVAPVFAAAPAAVTVECLADVPAMTNLGYTDNCDAAGTVAGTDGALVGGACGGTITRTWTITDACGNTTTATQTITVDDNTNPTASNPATTTVPGGPAPAVDPLVVIDEADNCSTPVVAFVSESNDGAACPLTITRIYSVTDACGNTINVTHTILITDPFPPTASNPAPVAVECIGDVPAPDVTVVTDEADNQGVPTVAFVNDVSNGMTCPEIITRTYSVTDVCNNVITVTQTITVDDITAPTATAPATVNVECIGDVPAANSAMITDEADNCTAAPVVAHVGDVSNGLSCPETITRTYSITDNCGNVTTVAQTIIVDDITAPTGTAPATVNVECIGDVPAANILAITNEADNCTAAPLVAHVGDVSDGLTCPETITRTYSITDNCGNVTTVSQSIIVNDITDPTASNPVTVAVQLASQVPAPDPTVVTNEADNCTAAPVVAWVSDVSDGNTCPETITRTYSVTDDCNNTITVVQIITVSDLTAPTASNPVAVNVECIGDVPAVDITVVTNEADNSGIAPIVAFVSDVSDGNTCPETITRTYSVTDNCNNTILVTQTIVVNDVTAPTATAPAAVTVECIGDVPAPNTALITNEADNCTAVPLVTFVSDVSDGNTCPETITRTYRITDDCNNTTNVTQTIIVHDVTAPTATAPPSLSVQCIGDVPPAPLAGIPSGMTGVADNCTANPTVNFVSDVSDGNTCPETITRTYSITDDCGNVTTVAQTIVVNDVTNPTASNPVAISVPGSMDVPVPDVTVVTNEADNCTANPIVAWVSDVSDGNVCNLEKITRTYSVTDDCGNQILVTQIITILAVYPPIDAGPDQSICLGDNTSVSAVNPMGVPITWDNGVLNGVSFAPTVTTTYSVTANNLGCISTDQLTIEVKDLPVVSFMPDINSGCTPVTVNFTNTTPNSVNGVWSISDGSQLNGIGTVSNTFDAGGCFDVSLTVTATNGCTNAFTASNLICVEEPPVAAFSPSTNTLSTINTEVSFNNNSNGAIDYDWDFGDESAATSVENPTHIYPDEHGNSYVVTLIAYSPMGCTDTAYASIQVIEELIYYVPNTFTPDGDAFNNTFKPIFTSGFDPFDYTLLIFDRWGETIFESHNSEIGWDGTYNGGLVQDGTYTWKLEFKSRENDKRMIDVGHVNMLK